jgi:thiol:disulfide interchange protein DsbD
MSATILSVLALMPGVAGVVAPGVLAREAIMTPDEFGATPRVEDLVQVRVMPAIVAPTTPGPTTSAAPTGSAAPTAPTAPTMPTKVVASEDASVKVLLPVVFTVASDWHTYWPGQNATGTPISWRVSAVPSAARGKGAMVVVGTPIYPAPTRYLGGGDLLDYALTGTFTVLLPLSITPGVGEDSSKTTVPLRVKIEYLVCKDSCIPGEVELTTEVPLAPVASGDGARSVDPTGGGKASVHVAVEPLPGGLLKAAWSDETPNARLALMSTPPQPMEFYPLEAGPELIDAATTGASANGNMLLRFRHPASAATSTNSTTPTIRGVVRLGTGASARAYELTLPWGGQPVTKP